MTMCWGLNMKPNRKYTQTILKSFHISGASIDEGKYAKLYLTADQNKYVLAHLDDKIVRQVPLDLNFCVGDKIMFQTTGDATISLIGYMHDGGESDDDDYEPEEYEALAKTLQNEGKAGANDPDSSEGDDDEEDDDNKLTDEYSSFLDEAESGEEEEEDDDDEDEDDDEEEEEDDSEDESASPQAKKAKLNENDKKAAKEQNGVAKKEANKQQQQKQQQQQQQQKQQKSKKDKKAAAVAEVKKEQPKGKDAKSQSSLNAERSLTGGVKVQDLFVGSGTDAKQGKRVSVYYIGRLKSNNKSFDSMQKGNGFKFALGAGEVIKGWDVGVVGMKVGGKRRITCPAHMAYGARGHPPTIPPNSTLVFDVELKAVH